MAYSIDAIMAEGREMEASGSHQVLKKCLTKWDLIAFGCGVTIGTMASHQCTS